MDTYHPLTNKIFVDIFRDMFLLYANPPDKEKVGLYVRELNKLAVSQQELEFCVARMIQTHTTPFFPSWADLLKVIKNGRTMTPDEAWASVTKFIRQNPPGTPYSFDDITTKIIDEFGGLNALRHGFNARERFVARYQEIQHVF